MEVKQGQAPRKNRTIKDNGGKKKCQVKKKTAEEKKCQGVCKSLSVPQPASEQLGAAAPGYLCGTTWMNSHCSAQVRGAAEPGMQI